MTCGCKHKRKQKRGSGKAQFLSGVTWHKGSGMSFKGGSVFRKRKKPKKGGMTFSGGGINFSGGGMAFDGGGLRWVQNKKVNGRRVI